MHRAAGAFRCQDVQKPNPILGIFLKTWFEGIHEAAVFFISSAVAYRLGPKVNDF